MSDTVRVFINSRPIEVAAGSTAIEAVKTWDPAEARAILEGDKAITDSRGIHLTTDAPVHNGAIFRIVRARASEPEKDDPSQL
ncbi:MAG TPA: hypothetical protein VM166_10275 [Gemmatimonadaceae bacterium]|nr:hypothetical protein [Gemmatimonadaceae bacterium]